jgi:serine/threonine protein kinase/WD40 repeat protein
MVTRRVPFRGEYEPAVEYAILHEEPEGLTAARAEATPEFEGLVGKCLKKSPAERYQSADELLSDLQQARSRARGVTPKAPVKSASKPEAREPARSKPASFPGTSATAVQILGDRYRIERLLGRGGMGEVWLAFDLKLGVEVALKFLLPELSSDPQRIALLRREVRTARNVASSHVCRVFDLIEIEGQELVSMEYVDGTTLQELLASQSPLDIVEARRIATQLLTGLQDIHNAGLIHRDLKPANVMITRSGRAVVMDFGLAKGVTDTQTVAVAGTPAYMAPEQMRGEELDARADLFAVGMILVEMVSPEGVRDPALRRKLWDGLRQDPPKAPAGPWEGAIRRAVAANRGERFASAAEMARALGETGQRLSGIEEVSPYPGLSAFTKDQARFFFGREMEVESVWRKVSRLPLAALIGPSGVGKSSFLRAGVIPARPEGWSVVICTPGDAPFTSLTQSLLPDYMGQTEAMHDLLRLQDIERSVPLLSKWRQRSKQALLIMDQFEELFTLNPPEVQNRFAELLGRLSIEADIHVLVSMRDDFFFLCHQYPGLRPLFPGSIPLGPLSSQDLRRAIVEPARLCGFAFEDDALVDEMMADVEGERGALPLVAFAAAKLWELRDREHGLITRRSYEEIGHVGGALAQHAETTLEKIGHEREDIVREIFRNLVTAQHTRVVRERDELLSVFEDRAAAEDVLNALIDARLLTSFELPETREDSMERRRIEVVHESLLTSWPRLVRWQTQDTDGAQLRDQLRQAAQLWKERSESDDLLWTGTAYKEFELWHERYPGGLTETEEAFGEAMGARAKRDRRRRRIVLGAAFAMLLAVIAVISWYGRAQKIAHLESEAGKLVALGRAKLEGNPTEALAYSISALELTDNPANRRFALEALSRGPMAQVRRFDKTVAATGVDFSRDGRLLAAGGFCGVQVVSRDESTPAAILEDYYITWSRGPCFGPDGDRIVWMDATDHRLVHVWSLKAGKDIETFTFEAPTFPGMMGDKLVLLTVFENYYPLGKTILRMWAFDKESPKVIARWNRADISGLYLDSSRQRAAFTKGRAVYVCPFEELSTFRGRLVGEHSFEVRDLAFDPSGERIASADTSGEIRLWSLADDSKKPIRVLSGDKPISGLQFAPDGTKLAAICSSRKRNDVCLWDLNGPMDADPLVYRFKYINLFFPNIKFDPTGQWIVVADQDQLVFWPVRRPNPYVFSEGWLDCFTPGGQSLVYASEWHEGELKEIRILNLKNGTSQGLCKLDPPKICSSMVLDSRGRFLVLGTTDDGALIVSMADGTVRQLPDDPPGGDEQIIALSANGRWVAGARAKGRGYGIRVWDLEADTMRVLEKSKGRNYWSLALSDSGHVFSGDFEGNIVQWNIWDGSSAVIGKTEYPFVQGVTVTRDGGLLLVESSRESNVARTTDLVAFDLKNKTSRSLTSHGHCVGSIAVDSSETLLATGDGEGVIRVGPITGGEPHWLISPPGICWWVVVSPDKRWLACSYSNLQPSSPTAVQLWRMPEGRPIHTLPHDQFLAHLRAQTNLRVVPDKASSSGYRVDTAPFPGWEKVPAQ